MNDRMAMQLERLFRHYSVAKTHVDYIACLDLAHTLRVWSEIANEKEMRDEIKDVKKFRCAKPSKKTAKALRANDADYIWLCMPIGLYAEVLKPGVFLPKNIELPFKGLTSAQSNVVGRNPGDPTGISGYYYGNSIGKSKLETNITSFLTLDGFMSSQLLLTRFDDKIQRYDVRFLIERIANALIDASHFQTLAEEPQAKRLTSALPLIAAVQVGSISLLYFILLYIAQEILVSFGKIERIKVIRKNSTKTI
ncbi:MAG: hypothetical protein MI976_04550 [Pseudomonadales bacterium]|nr:hypothetical protein [Pseudomonadales bacterium]